MKRTLIFSIIPKKSVIAYIEVRFVIKGCLKIYMTIIQSIICGFTDLEINATVHCRLTSAIT